MFHRSLLAEDRGPGTPEYPEVKDPTPELFWGCSEEISTPEHEILSMRLYFQCSKLEIITFFIIYRKEIWILSGVGEKLRHAPG